MTPKRIGLIGFDQVTALHLIGTADAFSAAALDDGYGGRIPCYEVCTIGAPTDCFRTESGLTFQARTDLASAPACDTIIVAGGTGLRQPRIVQQISEWLLHRAGETRRIGAVCTGVFALAPTGLLDGCEVTTHWRVARLLGQRFPSLKIDYRKPFVRSGRYYTSNGLSGGINLSLAMIQEDYGPHVARSVAQEVALSPYLQETAAEVTPLPNHTIDRFADLVAWIMRNLHADLSVEVLARRACMAQDHFSKAFKSVLGEPPSIFVENLRLNEAQRRLAKRQKTVQSVATSVGFANSGAFQRAFERRFGKRPSRLLDEPRTKPASLTKHPVATNSALALASAP
jgi:transcriptional regulator GlxA family with amidase domain